MIPPHLSAKFVCVMSGTSAGNDRVVLLDATADVTVAPLPHCLGRTQGCREGSASATCIKLVSRGLRSAREVETGFKFTRLLGR